MNLHELIFRKRTSDDPLPELDPAMLDAVDRAITDWGQTLDDTITREQARRLRELGR